MPSKVAMLSIPYGLMTVFIMQKDQYDQSKKKVKTLKQTLNQEKLERGEVEIRCQELEGIRQQYVEQIKVVEALRESLKVGTTKTMF